MRVVLLAGLLVAFISAASAEPQRRPLPGWVLEELGNSPVNHQIAQMVWDLELEEESELLASVLDVRDAASVQLVDPFLLVALIAEETALTSVVNAGTASQLRGDAVVERARLVADLKGRHEGDLNQLIAAYLLGGEALPARNGKYPLPMQEAIDRIWERVARYGRPLKEAVPPDEEVPDFRRAHWGMTRTGVLQSEEGASRENNLKLHENRPTEVLYVGTFAELEGTLKYFFFRDMLLGATYGFTKFEKGDLADFVRIITAERGEPVVSRQPNWLNNEYLVRWFDGETLIELRTTWLGRTVSDPEGRWSPLVLSYVSLPLRNWRDATLQTERDGVLSGDL